MRVVEALQRRFGSTSPPPQFECGLCAATFDYEPPNCPACGSVEIQEY